jgi:circadian clock protein KaiC
LTTVQSQRTVKTGVPGLDPLIQGGLREGDFILLLGDLGAGKTIFASQFAYYGASQYGERALYATLEEDVATYKRNMLRMGMDFDALEKSKMAKLIDLDALEGSGVASNMDAILKAMDSINAKRLVVDSLSAFLSGAQGKFDYSFLMRLVYKTLKRENVTTIMTMNKASLAAQAPARIEEFVSDGIFELQNYVARDVEMRTRFIVRKLRGTEHSRKYHSVLVTPKGIEILPYSG